MKLTFSGEVWEWRGPSPFHFVTVPEREGGMIEAASGLVTYGWGMVPCSITVGETTITTALWPKNGSYVVPLKDAIRKAEQIEIGDSIELAITITV